MLINSFHHKNMLKQCYCLQKKKRKVSKIQLNFQHLQGRAFHSELRTFESSLVSVPHI